jgi:transketolase
MAACAYRADNLCAIIDKNDIQATGHTADVFPIPNLRDKWLAFGWHVIEIDGHNAGEILSALDESKRVRGKPSMIIARTVKGKGFPFAENRAEYHNAALTEEEFALALRALRKMRGEAG